MVMAFVSFEVSLVPFLGSRGGYFSRYTLLFATDASTLRSRASARFLSWDKKNRLLSSIDKAIRVLGYEPKTDFKEGLALLIQDLGVNTALTRYIALWRSEDRHGDVQVLVRVGLTFKAAVAGAKEGGAGELEKAAPSQ